MNKIIIATDDANDLGRERLESMNVRVLPIICTLGDKSYYEFGEISPQDIFDFVAKTGTLPKTAARNIGNFEDFFRSMTSEGYDVIYISLSSGISASYNHACVASRAFDNVHVVNSFRLSTGVGLQIMYAYDLIQEGKLSAKEIADKVQERAKKTQTSFVVDTLEYLYKGGRCSGLARFFASMLNIRPSIIMHEENMGVGKKFKGKMPMVVEKYIESVIAENPNYDEKRIFITHSSAEPELVEIARNKVIELTKARPFQEIIVTVAGTTITSHCGKGTVGILFYNK